MKTKQPYATEAEMCAQFIADISEQRHLLNHQWGAKRLDPKWPWVCYPETGGWDILLVRRTDGFQIGVEAKLRLNVEVVNQAIEDRHDYLGREGPDCRAVLVPSGATLSLSKICEHIGVTVITIHPPQGIGWSPPYQPYLPDIESALEHPAGSAWFEQCPTRRHQLPEYVPDVSAGVPGPVQLTAWKIKAIKIAIIIDHRGAVTRDDFRAIGIDMRRWGVEQWLELMPDRSGWRRGPYCPNFKAQHPMVYEQIAADAPKWMPAYVRPASAACAEQPTLI